MKVLTRLRKDLKEIKKYNNKIHYLNVKFNENLTPISFHYKNKPSNTTRPYTVDKNHIEWNKLCKIYNEDIKPLVSTEEDPFIIMINDDELLVIGYGD